MMQPSQQWLNNDAFASGPYGKSRGVAALLALFLGYLGVHYFYCGKAGAGVTFLLVNLILGPLTCGIFTSIFAIFTLIQAILMFCMTNEDFERKYVGPESSSFPLF